MNDLIQDIWREYTYIRTKSGDEKIYLRNILYVCINKRNLCFHLDNGKNVEGITLQSSFEKAIGHLKNHPDFLFYPPSLLINLKQITVLNKNYIKFDTGEKLYFPQRAYETIKTKLSL